MGIYISSIYTDARFPVPEIKPAFPKMSLKIRLKITHKKVRKTANKAVKKPSKNIGKNRHPTLLHHIKSGQRRSRREHSALGAAGRSRPR
jgi:hypothetical protein